MPWTQRERIESLLARVVAGGISRAEAYEMFRGSGAIPYLGPAYFTKLLYFFWPQETCYIMDQWTAKSINYLAGTAVVPMYGAVIAERCDGACYEAFCKAVEQLAAFTPADTGLTGAQTEMRMFCRGGKQPGPWRAIIRQGR